MLSRCVATGFFLFVALMLPVGGVLPPDALSQWPSGQDDLLFIHHSCGANWLSSGLHPVLLAKGYINERNDITYGTDLAPDAGRPDSLASTPGDRTDMNHWILWFNDYFQEMLRHGCADGTNRIILFKSCYPISGIGSAGTEPGNPFSSSKTLANYKALYRHPGGTGGSFTNNGYVYKPLEDVFAEHPEILFIPVTAPPLCNSCTTDADGHRARLFNNWLKTEWYTNYTARYPNHKNVAVFDWFDVLANADSAENQPNRLKAAYGGTSSDSHPNGQANATSTWFFATRSGNFMDTAWNAFCPAWTQQTFRLNAVALTNSVVLRWDDPAACGYTSSLVYVRYDTSDYPSNIIDGTEIYSGEETVLVHTNRTPGQTCYYTVWPEAEYVSD